ncbi:MOSC domain-containing protein [Litorivita sp. NS0012-18]
MTQATGQITQIWRFPIQSMGGERVAQAEITTAGLVGDRALALLDVETGKVASAKSVRLFPDLMACHARFEKEPARGEVLDGALPNVEITLPNGRTVDSLSAGANASLSAFFGRELRLISGAPDDFVVDQYHPDLPNLNPAGNRDVVVPQPLGSSLFRALGQEPPLGPHSLQDLFPLSVITSGTLSALRSAVQGSSITAERFRMNLLVEETAQGLPENQWVGRTGALGEAVIAFAMPAPRCVMTTRPTAGLSEDTRVLRAISETNRLDLLGIGAFPCAGIYAVAVQAGTIRQGDSLQLRG